MKSLLLLLIVVLWAAPISSSEGQRGEGGMEPRGFTPFYTITIYPTFVVFTYHTFYVTSINTET